MLGIPPRALPAAGTYVAVHKNSQLLVTQRLQFLPVVKVFRGELIFDNVVQKQVLHVAVNRDGFICRKKNKNKKKIVETSSDSLKMTRDTKNIQTQIISHTRF